MQGSLMSWMLWTTFCWIKWWFFSSWQYNQSKFPKNMSNYCKTSLLHQNSLVYNLYSNAKGEWLCLEVVKFWLYTEDRVNVICWHIVYKIWEKKRSQHNVNILTWTDYEEQQRRMVFAISRDEEGCRWSRFGWNLRSPVQGKSNSQCL